ncbi:hypothetical protein DDB_G0291213 [Dictyostelium discoideum AX4]|uniref:Integrase zinc-binding domain-containing protein n=1 Tax=Dictyostelium discoideum TaxID=44689 RepID=Q54EZ7_DICDI|nr:hypothetical protein DDB_G0291213 [Dictyostelium discoideum AX4]EAL61833.1 hypothetical protein DDB_G0291213 [Dictyostelium discoideum AX4]|eukprot:XP_635336.1 hypothetical protein DDB_G0291213 [Dictyostelium discoideum AX4]
MIAGKKNGIADFLSRKYDNFQWDESFLNKIKEEQINSQWLLEMKKNPNLCIEEINDIWYLNKETIRTLIREYHDTKYSGHHALDITYNNIRQDYYFKEMFSIIKRYIKSCATCQLNINRKDKGILQSLEIPFEVWRDISIDFLSLPKTMYARNGFTVDVDQVCIIVFPCYKTIDAPTYRSIIVESCVQTPWLSKGYPEPEWIKEVDTDCEELVREYWNKVQKKQLNSRRERENVTTEAVKPIVSSPLSQEVQSSQTLQPITPRQQNSNSNQRNQSKKRKSRNQDTSSDDDELDLSLQIKTTRSGRKVTPKRL